MKDNKWAVVIGRFQPFHKEHKNIFDEIIRQGINNVLVLLGQQNSVEKDPLHFIHRANFFRNFLYFRFDQFAISPTYDTDQGDDVWAQEVLQRIMHATPINSKRILFVSRKQSDVDTDGYHYAEALEKVIPVHYVPVQDEDVSATRIRKNYSENEYLVHPSLRILMSNGIRGTLPVSVPRFETKWMNVRQAIRPDKTTSEFLFSSRRNRDSVAFVLKHKDHFGFIIEGKPPIGCVSSISAFGGGFDKPNDDPYRILYQEILEEAGFEKHQVKRVEYKGSYQATTQSDEIVHCFLAEVDSIHFNPQTIDEGEQENEPVWVHKDDCHIIADWRVKLIIGD